MLIFLPSYLSHKLNLHNNSMLNIPIVIAAYNRKASLIRLLLSLNNAIYPEGIKLIISIDGGGDNNSDIIDIANKYEWRHGDKEIIKHEQNLGLREHIINCGRLSNSYDGIILLEDDLFVAPYFYDFIQTTQSKYSLEQSIAGVSLYSHLYNETACLPFTAVSDEYDVFFMQLACSWGQCWLSHQWQNFENWYDKNSKLDLSKDTDIPYDVRLWPDTSWKKYFIKFMIDENKFFVYPHISQVTNFGEAGQNHTGTNLFQVPLQFGKNILNLPEFSSAISKYDAFCEILPNCLSKLNKELLEYDFDVDLYGVKDKKEIKTEYILTTQKVTDPIKCYGRYIKPHELNVIENIAGNDIFFVKTKNMHGYKSFLIHRYHIYTDYETIHQSYYAIKIIHYDKLISQIPGESNTIERIQYGVSSFPEKVLYKIINKISKLYRRVVK